MLSDYRVSSSEAFRPVPEVRYVRVRIARDERLFSPARKFENRAPHRAYIRAIDVNADRYAIFECVADGVDVARTWRQGDDRAGFQAFLSTGDQSAVLHARIIGRKLRAPKNADKPPDAMIMDGRLLSGPPDEAHD